MKVLNRAQKIRYELYAITYESKATNQSGELSSRTAEHYQRLLTLLEQDKIYRDPNLNMSVLASHTGLSNGYQSQIINQKRGQNFFDFINSYRVEEVKSRIADQNYAHYSLLGIAQEAGFKSKSTFNAVFKKMTNLTPSQYKKSVKQA